MTFQMTLSSDLSLKQFLTKRELQDTFVSSSVDPDSVPYLDKTREKRRLAKLEAARASDRGKAPERQQRPNQHHHQQQKKLPAAKRRKMEARQDDIDLDEDWRLLKKLRKGKITDEEYENLTMM